MKLKKTLSLVLALILITSVSTAFAGTVAGSVLPAAMISEGDGKITITIANDNTPQEDGSGKVISDIGIFSADYPEIFFDTAGVVINPGESKSFSASCYFFEEMIGVSIPFNVSWIEGDKARDKNINVKVQRTQQSNVTITRNASTKQASPGDEITLTYKVTNGGEIPVTIKSIIDREISGKSSLMEKFQLEPGETMEIPYVYKMGKSTVESAPVVTFNDGSGDMTSSAAPLSLGMVNSKISIEVIQGEATANGVPFTLNLTNNGNQKVSDIKITDDQGNRVNSESFALAVGENRQLSYNVLTDSERYVVFKITGSTSSGDKYEDNTKSYTVRKFIDPSLLGIDFSASVVETLNSAGSIQVKFDINNTGTMEMKDLIISEKTTSVDESGSSKDTLNELYRADVIPTGLFTTTQTVYVGEPRDLAFVVDLKDPAGNPYTYTAYITAEYLGVSDTLDTAAAQESAISTLGAGLGDSVSRAMTIALAALAVLTVVSVIAMIILSALEKRQRREAAKRRAMRDRQRRG